MLYNSFTEKIQVVRSRRMLNKAGQRVGRSIRGLYSRIFNAFQLYKHELLSPVLHDPLILIE